MASNDDLAEVALNALADKLHPIRDEHPCYDAGLACEFTRLVNHVAGSIASCGVSHAELVANDVAAVCFDADRIMFHALCEFKRRRARLALILISEKARFHREGAGAGSNLEQGLSEINDIAVKAVADLQVSA